MWAVGVLGRLVAVIAGGRFGQCLSSISVPMSPSPCCRAEKQLVVEAGRVGRGQAEPAR